MYILVWYYVQFIQIHEFFIFLWIKFTVFYISARYLKGIFRNPANTDIMQNC